MDAEIKERLTSRDLWMRALFMLFFAIAYGVTRIVITLLVVFQFLTVLFTGHANEPLLRFGYNLGAYVLQILRFETFNTEDRPFPFADWPDEDPGENRWIGDGVSAGAEQDVERSIAEAGDSEPVADADSDAPDTGLKGGPADPRVR